MNSKLFYILLSAVFFCFSAVSEARAATITVNTLTDENNTNAAACSLREAINNANNDNTASGAGCVTGSGADNIVFAVSGTINLAAVLPNIATAMNIGNNTTSAPQITINRDTGGNYRHLSVLTGASVVFSGIVFNNGFADQDNGGSIENTGTLTVNNCVFSNNRATYDSGAIRNDSSSLTVINSTFTNNSAGSFGGAVFNGYGTSFSITGSTFSGNTANIGGAVHSAGPIGGTISNSTFFNNTAGYGGGVDLRSPMSVINCTISGNKAGAAGGGISFSQTAANRMLINTIVAGNTNVAGNMDSDLGFFAGGTVDATNSFNNIIGTGGAGGLTNGANGNQTNVPLANIRLLPLGNYGGLVQTMPIRTNSPARNAGRNTGAPSTDARGYNRPQATTVDIGAFEIQTNSVVTNTANSGTGSLRDTVAAVPANEIVQFETPIFYNSARTISLSGGQIAIAQNVTIYGNGANLLTVRNTSAASATSRVFNVGNTLTVTLYGMSITGGNITGSGGGISTINGTLTVNDCYIHDNSAGVVGGGIRNGNGTLIVNNTTISNNVANSGGGALNAVGGGIDSVGTLILNNVTVSGNSVPGSGQEIAGGVYTSNATITNSTIANNTAPAGANASGLRVSNVVTIRNSIVAANVNNGTVPDVRGAFTSNGFNFIGNRGSATGFTQPTDQTGSNPLFENADEKNLAPAAILDPNLLPLALNGAAVPTHAFNGVSPAIDKGNSFGLTTDARGLTRPVDLSNFPNAAGSDGADIGAFEAQLAPTAAGTSISGRVMLNNGSGLVNATVYLTDSQGNSRSARTASFGNYQFEDVAAGQTYVIVVVSKRYQFTPQILSVSDNVNDLNFIAIE